MSKSTLLTTLSIVLIAFFSVHVSYANPPSYDELACERETQEAETATDDTDEVEVVEAGQVIELTGTIEKQGDGWILRTANKVWPFVEGSKIPEEKSGTYNMVTALVPQGEAWTIAIKPQKKINAFFQSIGNFFSSLPFFGTKNSGVARRPIEWKLPESVSKEATEFLTAYGNYVTAAHKNLREKYKSQNLETCSSCKNPYSVLTKLNRTAHANNKTLYTEAMNKLKAYVKKIETSGLLAKVDKKGTYVVVDKVAFLLAVLDKKSGEALYIVPTAYGAHPSGAHKEANGDLKTPNIVDPTKLSYEETPYFIGRRYGGTIVKGMTVRCMGVSSKDKSDAYWVQYGMNIAIHGTPSWWSMGLRASHGCFRVQEERVKLIYDLTAKDTPIVVYGVTL